VRRARVLLSGADAFSVVHSLKWKPGTRKSAEVTSNSLYLTDPSSVPVRCFH
jgi:hypothetical protein